MKSNCESLFVVIYSDATKEVTAMTRLSSLRYRLVLLVALMLSLAALLAAPATSQQSSCCTQCLQRFQQCDGNTIVCCKIYNACIQQCQGACPSCPDK